jgi:FMN-dependent NADH-azoreductase
MKTLLQINSSLNLSNDKSSQLAERLVDQWRSANSDGRVVTRDLVEDPVPHLDQATLQAFAASAQQRSASQQVAVALSDTLIWELDAGDVLVLGLPMYNFGVPSTLKAYFDHIARAGVTFRYTANGPQGLMSGKKAYVAAARGGRYVGTPRDTQSAYVRDFLAFIGISDVEFIYAEGLASADGGDALEGGKHRNRKASCLNPKATFSTPRFWSTQQ